MNYKILLPRQGDKKPIQLFANNSTVALNEARELSCRNEGKEVEVYVINEVLINRVSCASLDEGKANKDVVKNTEKEST